MKKSRSTKNPRVPASPRESALEDGQSGLLPKLRFPEFQEDWVCKPFDDLYSFKRNNALSRDKLNYEVGSVKNVHYGDIHTKFGSLFDTAKELVPYINDTESVPADQSDDYCVEGDLIFADASEDTNDVGKCIEIVKLHGDRLVSGLHTILARRNGNRIIVGFGGHLFRSGYLRTQIRREAQGTKVYAISGTRLRNVRVAYPSSPSEQRKIASCLSSLDELIGAQGRKVDALRTHKKGLMQQLFPREGETQPRIRFPEFQDDGDWEEKRLGEIGRVIRGSSPRPKGDPRYYGGPIPRLMVQDVTRDGKWVTPRIDSLTEEGAKLSRPCPAGTLTIVCSGNVGVVSFLAVEACIHDGFLALIDINEQVIAKDFLFHSLSTLRDRFENDATHGGVFTNLTTSTVEQFQIMCPVHFEQQRIASCLSSLDALITAETQKLEALKIHKKGLMQQLFPSPEVTT